MRFTTSVSPHKKKFSPWANCQEPRVGFDTSWDDLALRRRPLQGDKPMEVRHQIRCKDAWSVKYEAILQSERKQASYDKRGC